MTGTPLWAVRGDGKLVTSWVRRGLLGVYQRLTTA
jgi:hypothetical protein